MELVIAQKNVSVKINDRSTWVSTHLCGHIGTTYDKLVEKLGEPDLDMCGDKVRAEWTLEVTIDNKTVVATIYDWKEFQPVEHVTDWHIGGVNEEAVMLIKAIFPNEAVTNSRW